jgi:dsDNA-specific endonuclease/ATPase MutS2
VNPDFKSGVQELSDEAKAYLDELESRTAAEWQKLHQDAEKLRREAMLSANNISSQDYDQYNRFFQPVKSLVSVMKQSLQQALQKNKRTREITELRSGDDIDDESLALVRPPTAYIWRRHSPTPFYGG